MINQVAEALDRKDYRTAADLLKKLVKQEPKNPLVRLYIARLQEATGKLESAQNVYKQLLQNSTNPKIISQARQGLSRVEAIEKEQRRQALAEANADPNSGELGLLVLEPLSSELKQAAAPKLARIMQIDAYSARLLLPSRGWRLYRTGSMGDLRFFVSSLRSAEIPAFAVPLSKIQSLNVFQVNYFSESDSDSRTPECTAVCQNTEGQLGSLNFSWGEVTQRVEGLLPLFDEVVDWDSNRQLQRKTQILDYVPFCDLHLPQRNSILRLCDRNYQFQQGIILSPTPNTTLELQLSQPKQSTTQKNWSNLQAFLNRHLSQKPLYSDFKFFAETALDYREMLGHVVSHIDLFRRQETLWDPAFQLYSGLAFFKNVNEQ